MGTVTRAAFRDAIEAGIQAARPDRATCVALRDVATYADEFAVGSFKLGRVGCPLTQAVPDPARRHATPEGVAVEFAVAFDRAVDPDGVLRVLRVID